jgi:Protein of unknown function (DUF429).
LRVNGVVFLERLQDEIDAIACLLTGIMFLEGRAELLEGEDGAIIIPKAI